MATHVYVAVLFTASLLCQLEAMCDSANRSGCVGQDSTFNVLHEVLSC